MSPEIPTTADLNTRIISQLEGKLGQTIPILPKAFARVLSWVLAGMFVLLYRYCGFIFLQMFVAHASMEETTINGKKLRPLVELGRKHGVGDPQDATRAELNITVSVTNQTGNLPSGQKLVRSETGVIYEIVAAVPLNAATITAHMRAISDGSGNGGVGEIGNLVPGDVVSFANPQANVATEATVSAVVLAAADAETPEHYRARVFDKVSKPPQGGAYADYEEWGIEVPGVVNIYPYAGEDPSGSGPGYVDVFVETDPDVSGDPDGYLTPSIKAAVLTSINLNNTSGRATRRPVNAAPNVQSITRRVFDVEISGLSPDAAEVRADLLSGITEHMLSREPFIEGLSALPRDDRVTQAAVSGIVETVVSALGATVTTVTLLMSGTPIPAYTLGHGEKAKLGSLDYV